MLNNDEKTAVETVSGEVPELLTLQEACALLKLHPNTLRQWDNNGTLPAIRIGAKRVRRYKKEDIISYLNSHL